MAKLFYSTIILLVLTSSALCFADTPLTIRATVDKTTLAADEVVQLTIKIEGVDSAYQQPEIDMPSLGDNFTIVATSRSNTISMKGGKIQVNWQLGYSLIPKTEGTIIIESATLSYKGKTYATDALTLSVTAPRTPKAPLPDRKSPKKVPWSQKKGVTI